MNICNHLIKQSEIIGIGPLMIRTSSDPAMKMLYKEKQYFFELHLSGHSAKIESNWISFADHLTKEDREKNNKEAADFVTAYDLARGEVAFITEGKQK